LVSLAQPLAVSVTPVLALALGMASRPQLSTPGLSDAPLRGRAVRTVALAGTVVSCGVSIALVWGQMALARASAELSEDNLRVATRLLPNWPIVHSIGWRVAAFQAIDGQDPALWTVAIARAKAATDADPAVSALWVDLGDLYVRQGELSRARDAYEEGHRRYPWSTPALNGLIYLASHDGDADRVARLCAQRALVSSDDCESTIAQIYSSETAGHLLP
jgi:hypothetical protein